MKKGNGLNGFQIKLIMALLMVLDHVDKIPGLLPAGWDGIFHAVTRCVGVWFAFAAVEGFIHTRNRITYNLFLGGAHVLWKCNFKFSFTVKRNTQLQ